MKRLLLCLSSLVLFSSVAAQTSLVVKGDSVKVRNGEFIIENQSKSIPGVLVNTGNGRTEFKRLQLENLGDTAIAISGQDTIRFKGGGGVTVSEGNPLILSVRTLNASQQQLKWWKAPQDFYTAPKVGILGGSQGTGDYTSTPANAISGRLTTYVQQVAPGASITNYSSSGYNTRRMMPSGANQWVDNSRNITKALADGNRIIILVTPSNDADPANPWGGATPMSETMANIAVIEDACNTAGATLFVFSGFPRHNFALPYQMQQLELSNLLLKKFGSRCAYVYKLLEDPANPYQLNPVLERGDHAHVNDQGALVAFIPMRDVLTAYYTSNTLIAKYLLQRASSLSTGFTDYQTFATPDVNFANLATDNNFYRVRFVNQDQTYSAWSNIVQGMGGATGGAPVVDAGPDQSIMLPAALSLSAVGSDPVGTITGYLWTKQSGGTATITTPAAAQTTVTDLVPGLYVFRCTATNNNGVQVFDEVQVTVKAFSDSKIAQFNFSLAARPVAGYVNLYGNPHLAVITQTDGVTGISMNTVATTSWQSNAGATAVDNLAVVNDGGGFVVSQSALANAFFTGGRTAVVNLQVTGLTTGKLCKIIVTGNAVSSPRYTNVAIGSVTKEYNATGNSSKAATFDDLTIPADGKINIAFYGSATSNSTYGIVSAVVVEEKSGTAPVNQPPVVNAGSNQNVTLPATPTLTAIASDPDGSIASYSWTLLSGTSATITSPATASTTITGLAAGTYVFRCTVTDDKGATAYSDVQLTVTDPNAARNAFFNFSMTSKQVAGFVNLYGHPHVAVLSGTSSSGIGINTLSTTAYVPNGSSSALDNLNVIDDGGGFIVPQAALNSVIFTASSTAADNLQVTGLTAGKHCKIILTANAVSSPRIVMVRINGVVQQFNATQNSSKSTTFDNLLIPADGKINIAFYAQNTSSYAGLASAVVVTEYTN